MFEMTAWTSLGNESGYWFTMQIVKMRGSVTSLPINWLLVTIGWKEAMG
jgi:hypothetical protein